MNALIIEVHRKKEQALFNQSKSTTGPFFAIPSKWYLLWLKYLKGGAKPTRIYLTSLLDTKTTLKHNLAHTKDYYLLSKKLWNHLKLVYGCDSEIECPEKSIYSFQHNPKLPSYISSRTTSPSVSKCPSFKSLHSSKGENFRILKNSCSSAGPIRHLSTRPHPDLQLKPTESLTKFSSTGIVGLRNRGCYCFMNTALQCILSLTEFHKALLKVNKQTPLVNIAKDLFFCMKTGAADNEKFAEYFMKEFPEGKQHDMPEFLRSVIDGIDKELSPSRKFEESDPWREYEKNHSAVIVNLFSGLTCSKVICKKCWQRKENYEPFISLTLEVSVNLLKSIEKYLEKETIVEQYFCNSCCQITDIEKQYCLLRVPNVLIIQLKRFVTVPFSRKINMQCEFEMELELSISNNEKIRYYLRAVAVHSGNANSGHYTAYCKRNNRWYFFDDLITNEVDYIKVKESQAYVLIYTRISN